MKWDPSMSAKWAVKWARWNEHENFSGNNWTGVNDKIIWFRHQEMENSSETVAQHKIKKEKKKKNRSKKSEPSVWHFSIYDSSKKKNIIISVLSLICFNIFSAFVILGTYLYTIYKYRYHLCLPYLIVASNFTPNIFDYDEIYYSK